MADAINRHNTSQAKRTADLEMNLKAAIERFDSVNVATDTTNAAQYEELAEFGLKIESIS